MKQNSEYEKRSVAKHFYMCRKQIVEYSGYTYRILYNSLKVQNLNNTTDNKF